MMRCNGTADAAAAAAAAAAGDHVVAVSRALAPATSCSLPTMSLTWSLQALLVRHEAYVVEAERDKSQMSAEIERLNVDKKELEDKNASASAEKQNLLEQLESVNTAVTDSDVHIRSLTATLQTTQAELHKLHNLASRTDKLERELEQYEREQAELHAALSFKSEEERTATLRWQDAERRLGAFEKQLETIDQDAREERERHVEIVGRMERQRVVEKELETANGRLRGAAAGKTMAKSKHGSAVVSHFVKDILQDNANLQMGIVELRELLTASNDEVERLRGHIAQCFPQDQLVDDDDDNCSDSTRLSNLGQEMSRASAQELHVHHHYHAPTPPPPSTDPPSRRQSQTLRRPKKKRQSLASGLFTPSSASRTPRSSISSATASSSTLYTPASTAVTRPSSSSTILSQTAVTVPQHHRWSMQSAYTLDSSIASTSPSTLYQAPSLFDRGFSDAGMDSSRPTSPDSEGPGSPLLLPVQSKRSSAGYFRNIPALPPRYGNPDLVSSHDHAASTLTPLDADLDLSAAEHDTIPEEDEQDLLPADGLSSHHHSSAISRSHDDDDDDDDDDDTVAATPPLAHPYLHRSHRRATSHESFVSISGLEARPLRPRPSQLLGAHGTRSFSSQPVVSATVAHAARPAMTPRTSDNSRSLLSGMAADQRAASAGTPPKTTLGKKVGGWVFGRWGAAPTPTVTLSTPLKDIRFQNPQNPSSAKTPASPTKLRPPGINQAGSILGIGSGRQVTADPVVTRLDQEALRQSLSEA